MQPSTEQQITTTGTIPGVRTPMGVSQKDIAHIMSVLTEQYSDAAMAALREIAANARDAHIRAGKADVPIRITLPNRYSTDLIIEDEGIGMSVEFMEKRFTQYGDSDKRDEEFDIGGFGIGGKAPLAYTDTYTLVTVKDHEEATFIISRDASGAAEINRLPVRATDAGNGTKVKIPAHNTDDFDEKARFLFKFWPEGSVLVNGEAPVRHKGKEIADNIWYNADASQSYLIMGGLPYRIASPQRYLPGGYLQRFHYIAVIGVNDADVTPSREDLKYTPKTIAALKAIGEKFESNFTKMVSDEIEAAPTAPDAWDLYSSWTSLIGARYTNDMKYKGMSFTSTVKVNATRWKRDAYRYMTNNNRVTELSIAEARQGLFITGRDDTSSYTKSRIRMWINSDKGIPASVVYFVDEVPTSPWVAKFKHATWADIISVKPARTGSGSAAGTFERIEGGYWSTIDRDELADADTQILFMTPKSARSVNIYHMWHSLKELNAADKVTIIKLPQNRWSKFRKDFPGSEDFTTWAKSFARLKAAEIPDVAWELKSLDGNSKYLLRMLKNANIHDPELKKLRDTVLSNTDEVMISRLNTFLSYADVFMDFSDKTSDDWFKKNYPLTKSMYPHTVQAVDLVHYLNAAYAARKEN